MNIIKKKLEPIFWVINKQFGLRPSQILKALRGIPKFIQTYRQFKQTYHGSLSFKPCLKDWFDEGGETYSEYFLQDLYVARQINLAKPNKHVDIGSRVDGFVANIASFREVEVLDIRPISNQIPGIVFHQRDMMKEDHSQKHFTDSLSCLHALEHFGLGRYGDNIAPKGYKQALKNMADLVKDRGTFYLSVPVGKERVEFNAHRIFNPFSLVKDAEGVGWKLTALATINKQYQVDTFESLNNGLHELAKQDYALGIFTFTKES